jgi:hypothetical protein
LERRCANRERVAALAGSYLRATNIEPMRWPPRRYRWPRVDPRQRLHPTAAERPPRVRHRPAHEDEETAAEVRRRRPQTMVGQVRSRSTARRRHSLRRRPPSGCAKQRSLGHGHPASREAVPKSSAPGRGGGKARRSPAGAPARDSGCGNSARRRRRRRQRRGKHPGQGREPASVPVEGGVHLGTRAPQSPHLLEIARCLVIEVGLFSRAPSSRVRPFQSPASSRRKQRCLCRPAFLASRPATPHHSVPGRPTQAQVAPGEVRLRSIRNARSKATAASALSPAATARPQDCCGRSLPTVRLQRLS